MDKNICIFVLNSYYEINNDVIFGNESDRIRRLESNPGHGFCFNALIVLFISVFSFIIFFTIYLLFCHLCIIVETERGNKKGIRTNKNQERKIEKGVTLWTVTLNSSHSLPNSFSLINLLHFPINSPHTQVPLLLDLFFFYFSFQIEDFD